MRVFKWSPSFHVDKEPLIAHIWFSLPKSPIHYFNKECLFHIVSCLGWPLFMDSATSSLARLSVARVCVEVDLLKPQPKQVWIRVGTSEAEGFYQSLEPEEMSAYCGHCFKQGHIEDECRAKFSKLQNMKMMQ